jgi:hypothetical protein
LSRDLYLPFFPFYDFMFCLHRCRINEIRRSLQRATVISLLPRPSSIVYTISFLYRIHRVQRKSQVTTVYSH